jgi:hypothetical protein
MNKMMSINGYDNHYMHSLIKIPPEYNSPINKNMLLSIINSENITTKVDKFNFCITPYVLTVNLIKSAWHAVAVLKTPKGLLYIDPYKEKVINLGSPDELFNYFDTCIELSRIAYDTGEIDKIQFMCLDGELLEFDRIYK